LIIQPPSPETEVTVTAIVLRGDARHLPLPDGCVDLIVTSPPYFGLRSYTDTVKCLKCIDLERDGRDPRQAWPDYAAHVQRDHVQHYDGQIGSEATPQTYLEALWACTAEWVRVLKPGGSMFINLGDKYAGCTDRLGLILRAEVIWAKPNGLPESVTDRVRRAHEQVFHFTRQPRYYAAVDEIREPHAEVSLKRAMPHRSPPGRRPAEVYQSQPEQTLRLDQMNNPLGKLPGSVWSIPSAPLQVPARLGIDHFAAFPPALVRPLVLGWSPPGVCTGCGEGRRPVATTAYVNDRRNKRPELRTGFDRHAVAHRKPTLSDGPGLTTITGYACACPSPDAPTRPALVVDPFCGTGTTMLVASAYGRVGVGVDRSMDYARLARWRCSDPGERARARSVAKPPPVPDGQGALWGPDLTLELEGL
jgi:DNA modification methylase